MANGKRGDGPLSDMLNHDLHPFPADIEAMLREVLAIQPKFPDGRRPYVQQIEWLNRLMLWRMVMRSTRVVLRSRMFSLSCVPTNRPGNNHPLQ